MKPTARTIFWSITLIMFPLLMLSGSSGPVPLSKFDACGALNRGEVRFPTAGAGRVVFAVAKDYDKSKAVITSCVRSEDRYVQEWVTTGYAGANGFAPPGKMWEDTLYSPTGSFTMTEAFGRQDPGTALPYRTLNKKSRWGGTRGPRYNRYFEGRGQYEDENLWKYMKTGDYEQAVVINWNRPPDMEIQQGASYAIFLHAGNSKTWGCISTELETVEALLRNLVPGDRIVMGIKEDVFRTATGEGKAGSRQNTESWFGPDSEEPGEGVLGWASRQFSRWRD